MRRFHFSACSSCKRRIMVSMLVWSHLGSMLACYSIGSSQDTRCQLVIINCLEHLPDRRIMAFAFPFVSFYSELRLFSLTVGTAADSSCHSWLQHRWDDWPRVWHKHVVNTQSLRKQAALSLTIIEWKQGLLIVADPDIFRGGMHACRTK